MAFESVRSTIQDVQDNYYDLIELSDFGILTWLSFGAIFQLLCLAYLPPRVAALPPVLWISYRIFKTTMDTRGLFTTSFTDINRARWTTKLPQPSRISGTNDGIVLFVLGARINHPWGKLAPGNVEIDQIFKDMWREAEDNRAKWTYLGRSAALYDTSDTKGTTNIWVSYWKDLKGLQAFANSAAHRLGMDGYNKDRFPYMGIMHETYHAPDGSWETICDNFRPWGLGTVKYVDMDKEEAGEVQPHNTLQLAPKGSTHMFSRMGRRTA